MIKYIPVHLAKCDVCGQEIIKTNITQVEFIASLRIMKWTVGRFIVCPQCQNSKIEKEENQVDGLFHQVQFDFE